MPGFFLGNIKIENGLCLAPMAGMTDSPMRRICRDLGAEFAVSEMISACALTYNDEKTRALAAAEEGDSPLSLQIFGHDPDVIAKSIPILISSINYIPAAIDINMGCPVKKIVSGGDGSALMKNPDRIKDIVIGAKKACDKFHLPLTVKIRAGWDSKSVNAPVIAKLIADCGGDAICIHGRTREQMYSPSSSNEVIRAVREAVPHTVPVIGNGDITTFEDAEKMFSFCGCDGIMIGRAALGNPWLFSEISARLNSRPFVMPTLRDRIDVALRLLRESAALYGERTAVIEARTRAAYLIRDLRGGAKIRAKLNSATSLQESEDILESLANAEN